MHYPVYFHIGLPKTGTTTIQYVLRHDSRINVIGNRYFNRFEYWLSPYRFCKPGLVNIVSEENQILQMEDLGKLNLLLSRIKTVSPEAQIILTIREQRELLESRYKYNFPWYGGYTHSFQNWLQSAQGMDYLSVCMYSSIYDTLLAFFRKEQIHILFFEELKTDFSAFFTSLYGIMGMAPPYELIKQPVIKNESLSESELLVLKRLNAFKIFRSNSKIAKYELRFFLKIARLFRSAKKHDEFRWSTINGRERIEKDFAQENLGLISRGVISMEKLARYNYLIEK